MYSLHYNPTKSPHADLPDVTSLQVSNNIIKETENTSATIQCNLKEAGNLSVKIYNAKGGEIITLFDGHREAGSHKFMRISIFCSCRGRRLQEDKENCCGKVIRSKFSFT